MRVNDGARDKVNILVNPFASSSNLVTIKLRCVSELCVRDIFYKITWLKQPFNLSLKKKESWCCNIYFCEYLRVQISDLIKMIK